MTAIGDTAPDSDAGYSRRLLILFGLVYFAQGIGQDSGLVDQPLVYFFKEELGFDAAQTTEYRVVLTIPWVIKPLYGLVSDFVPLLGYRRKTWLVLTNLLAVSGLLWLSGVVAPGAIVLAMVLTAIGTAASDVIIDAVMVENGKRTGQTAEFQSVQWLWVNIASIVSSLLGGYLCTVLKPATALHTAALVTALAPLAVLLASWMVLYENKGTMHCAVKVTAAGVLEAFQSRTLWAVIAFLAFWHFSPSVGTPWYYHLTDTMKFSQAFIGTLGACEAVGGVIGAIAYWRYFSRQSLRRQLSFGIWSGTIGTLLLVLLLMPTAASPAIAVGLSLVLGVAGMIAQLATLTLAAQACPARSEGFTFAALMSVMNGVTQISAIIGARLYTDVFQSMLPLILVSAVFTFACFLVMPLLSRARIDGGGGAEVIGGRLP